MAFDGAFNKQPQNNANEVPAPELQDFKDSPDVYKLLARLPAELRLSHMKAVEMLDDDEALEYLQPVLEGREEALRDTVVSEPLLQGYFSAHEQEILNSLETHVFTDTQNYLGNGQTAQVKRLSFDADAPVQRLAVKYLVSPTQNTLNVASEHNLIQEVERIQRVEEAETNAHSNSNYIRVPHPYFYYRNKKTQCYGMEEVDGVNLHKGTNEDYDSSLKAELRASLQSVDVEILLKEVDSFFDTMHAICIHNDVKPANMMVSRKGVFYLIDFGESESVTKVDDRSRDLFETVKEGEKVKAKKAIKEFLDALYRDKEVGY